MQAEDPQRDQGQKQHQGKPHDMKSFESPESILRFDLGEHVPREGLQKDEGFRGQHDPDQSEDCQEFPPDILPGRAQGDDGAERQEWDCDHRKAVTCLDVERSILETKDP